ncbi:type II secretion system protein [Candidatus Saccharibacteria bacterium]|nr:type II secretion system protein [Candidatus Saccharibacteria bacterium]MBB1531833.1 type II secretion system protein [Candidatus Saccharibacteria bacterium]MBB1549838.1 type II secretion system protein [Candidatus Saccharibacteria bacterium]MBF1037112.1 type II secretion system protein [Candidatus Nanosynbacter sp.]MBI1146418.1 type II secretion system protein [Candidatus Saccharibacteria bacterium]
MMKMKRERGFTILELVVVIFFASLLLILFFLQKLNLDAMHRDEQRKEAINAMYYALEEGFHAKNGYYPENISEENLKVMDPSLFTDPSGINLGQEDSDYTYEAANCTNGKCKEYTLKARLEKEDTYIKKNR